MLQSKEPKNLCRFTLFGQSILSILCKTLSMIALKFSAITLWTTIHSNAIYLSKIRYLNGTEVNCLILQKKVILQICKTLVSRFQTLAVFYNHCQILNQAEVSRMILWIIISTPITKLCINMRYLSIPSLSLIEK